MPRSHFCDIHRLAMDTRRINTATENNGFFMQEL